MIQMLVKGKCICILLLIIAWKLLLKFLISSKFTTGTSNVCKMNHRRKLVPTSACSRNSRPRDWSRLGSIFLVSVSPIISRDSRDQLYLVASQISLDSKNNPRVMPSSFKNIFEALNTIPPGSIKSKRTFGVTGFYTIKFRLFIAYFSKIGTRRKR